MKAPRVSLIRYYSCTLATMYMGRGAAWDRQGPERRVHAAGLHMVQPRYYGVQSCDTTPPLRWSIGLDRSRSHVLLWHQCTERLTSDFHVQIQTQRLEAKVLGPWRWRGLPVARCQVPAVVINDFAPGHWFSMIVKPTGGRSVCAYRRPGSCRGAAVRPPSNPAVSSR